jgi:hypothetical protein
MNFAKHFNNVKNFIGQGYHHGKRFLSHLDHAYRTGKDIYQMIEPSLQHMAPETAGKANKHFNKMDSNYNSIRDKVVDAHAHVNDIAGKLKSKNIHIGI